MNTHTARDGDTLYRRVNRTVARRLYASGTAIVLCPVKLYPFGAFRPSCLVSNAPCDSGYVRPFDDTVRDFEHYNCAWHETGYYAAFYVAAP